MLTLTNIRAQEQGSKSKPVHTSVVYNPRDLVEGKLYRVTANNGRGFSAEELREVAVIDDIQYTKARTENGAVIDIDRGEIVHADGVVERLTRTERQLMVVLVKYCNRVIEKEFILTAVWGKEYIADLNYLRVWMSRLRLKLRDRVGKGNYGGNGSIIKTINQSGYQLNVVSVE